MNRLAHTFDQASVQSPSSFPAFWSRMGMMRRAFLSRTRCMTLVSWLRKVGFSVEMIHT